MVEAHLHTWLGLLLRWGHLIVGIAWIGASFYFNWLENHLQRRDRPEGIAGDLWAVHGGGFYYLKKFAVAPGELPPQLHWFKWEAYATWLTGLALLITVFYWNTQAYMLGPDAAIHGTGIAVAIGLVSLAASWVVYDLLCCSPLSRREVLLGVSTFAWFLLLAWLLDALLSARAAWIHVGAAIGTVMVGNVFRVIIPAQKELVAAVREARSPDAAKGRRALQRSRHNNYLTLPVLFIMISGHYPVAYTHAQGWLLLAAMSLAGISVRHYFNVRHLGRGRWYLVIAAAIIAASVVITKPGDGVDHDRAGASRQVDNNRAYAIISERCNSCHAVDPKFAGFAVAPLGVELDNPEKMIKHAERIYQTVVVTRSMPLGNLTGMQEVERRQIAAWYQSQSTQEQK